MPSAASVITYPFDPTGVLVSNKITNEQQILTVSTYDDYHFLVPTFAPYFSNSMVIKYTSTSGQTKTLVEGIDYYCTHWFIAASRGCSANIYGSVSFLDLSLAGVISWTYQTIGGVWTVDHVAIAQILADRLHNPRITAWDVVVDLPVSFPPIAHAWDVVDLVGASAIVTGLAGIESIIRTNTNVVVPGATGATGPAGPEGAQGLRGLQGATGPAGSNAIFPYTPVQQGTGVGQSNNVVKMGWSTTGNKVKITIDSTDQGNVALEQWVSAITNLQAPIANPTFTGQVVIPEGTYLIPGLTFSNDGAPDTGLYHVSDGIFGFTNNATKTIEYSPTAITTYKPLSSNSRVTASDFVSTGANTYRAKNNTGSAGYGTFWRNDGSTLWLMLTNNNDADGTWNSLRPLAIELDNGTITIGNAALSIADSGNVTAKYNIGAQNFIGPGTGLTGTAAQLSIGGLAAKASGVAQGGGNGASMIFNFNGTAGQPAWVWGSNDSSGINMYVFNPLNFSVAYATTAGSASANDVYAWAKTPAKPTYVYSELPYLPVHQGGGINQTTDPVYIGWSLAGKVKVTIGATDVGNVAFESWVSNQLQHQPQLFTQSCTWTSTFTGTIYITAIGAGGSGGTGMGYWGGSQDSGGGGGGGGAGQLKSRVAVSVTSGQTIPITIATVVSFGGSVSCTSGAVGSGGSYYTGGGGGPGSANGGGGGSVSGSSATTGFTGISSATAPGGVGGGVNSGGAGGTGFGAGGGGGDGIVGGHGWPSGGGGGGGAGFQPMVTGYNNIGSGSPGTANTTSSVSDGNGGFYSVQASGTGGAGSPGCIYVEYV